MRRRTRWDWIARKYERRNLLQPEELPLNRGETDFAGAGRGGSSMTKEIIRCCLNAILKLEQL